MTFELICVAGFVTAVASVTLSFDFSSSFVSVALVPVSTATILPLNQKLGLSSCV